MDKQSGFEMKTTALTDLEIKVIKAYKKDDFVNDYGYEHPEAGAWVVGFHKDCGMSGKVFSGVMSSLSKKGVILCNGESFQLSEEGIEIARGI